MQPKFSKLKNLNLYILIIFHKVIIFSKLQFLTEIVNRYVYRGSEVSTANVYLLSLMFSYNGCFISKNIGIKN